MESNMEQRGMQAGEKRIGREETGELDRLFLDLPPREAYPLILAKAWEGSGRALFLLALYLDGGYGTFWIRVRPGFMLPLLPRSEIRWPLPFAH